jgi:SAM-dependent methyltransferase
LNSNPNNQNAACRICGNADGNVVHRTREMMFGTRDEFDYLECRACGSLQIAEIPDLAPYYPKNYYSLEADGTGLNHGLKTKIAARLAANYFVYGRNPLGRYFARNREWISWTFPPSLREPLLKINFQTRILDFGSGGGQLLQRLHFSGFRDLTGADAFIDADIVYPNGVRILKKSLGEIEPFYDLVMLHHSFEHLPAPLESLQGVARLLRPGSFCLVRIPVVAYAWEKYGVNWVQLDPPRHLYLFTERAMRALAEKAGFEVAKVVYDSESFQFFGSEQYVRDISMLEERAYKGEVEGSIFTAEQLKNWENEAARLNADGRGDQACFYLRKI